MWLRVALHEAAVLLPTLSSRKLWNYARVALSYRLARLTGRVLHWGRPVSLGIEPTTACNLRCPECPSGLRSFTRPTGRLTRSRYERLLEETHRELLYLMLYFQGEPYLHPDFLSMVRYAADRRVYTSTSTNGHFLDLETAEATVRSGLHRLIISLDGTTQEVYASYRRAGELTKVLSGIEHLMAARKRLRSRTPFVELQFIVFGHNEHQIPEVQALARRLGVDRLRLKSAQLYQPDQTPERIPQQAAYRRYTQAPDGRWQLRNRLLNHCWKLWQGAEVTWDGRVLPCCFDKDAQYVMGRFPEQASFGEIWQGEAYRAFRSQLMQGRAHIDICRNCTEGTRAPA